MRRPGEEPGGSTPARDTLTGSRPVRGTGGSEPGSVAGRRPDGEDPNPRAVLAHPSTSTPRRVPVAVIAGVEWVRLMERL